jgi:EXLDI family protein
MDHPLVLIRSSRRDPVGDLVDEIERLAGETFGLQRRYSAAASDLAAFLGESLRCQPGLAQPDSMRILVRISTSLDGSYDVVVPNKTIYVSDGDLALYQRAQELAGDNLSAAISAALRRYVDVEEGQREGFDEIIVRVGPGRGRKVRFTGVLLGEWVNSSFSRVETFRVYRGRTGKFVVHVERSPDYSMVDAEGKPAGWRGYLGIGDISYGTTPAESTLEVVGSLDELRLRIPQQLYDSVATSAQQPAVEDLDI